MNNSLVIGCDSIVIMSFSIRRFSQSSSQLVEWKGKNVPILQNENEQKSCSESHATFNDVPNWRNLLQNIIILRYFPNASWSIISIMSHWIWRTSISVRIHLKSELLLANASFDERPKKAFYRQTQIKSSEQKKRCKQSVSRQNKSHHLRVWIYYGPCVWVNWRRCILTVSGSCDDVWMA